MTKLEAFEELKDAWSDFSERALAERGTVGTYKGQALIMILGLADFLFEQIEDVVDLTEEANS